MQISRLATAVISTQPAQSPALEISKAVDTVTAYQTKISGKDYSADVLQEQYGYLAKVPNLEGGIATGLTAFTAERELDFIINLIV